MNYNLDVFSYLEIKKRPKNAMILGSCQEIVNYCNARGIHSITITDKLGNTGPNTFFHDFNNGTISNRIIKDQDYYELCWANGFVNRSIQDVKNRIIRMNVVRHSTSVILKNTDREVESKNDHQLTDKDYQMIEFMAEHAFIFDLEETKAIRIRDKSLMFFTRI